MNIKTKRIILYSLYGTISLTFVLSLLFVKTYINPKEPNKKSETNIDVEPTTNILDNTIPVFEEKKVLTKPYNDSSVLIGLNFYNYKDEEENQKGSLIYYQDTYMPSTGVFYSKKEAFNVISIYSGKVLDISKSDLLGNIIKIDHGNNVIGLYECVDDIKVNIGDDILQGTILSTSSMCNVFSDKGNGLYLELIHDGKNINPEYYYGKTIEEIE